MPNGLSFNAIGPVTRVADSAGHINVKAVSTQPIEDLTVAIQDAVTKAGYRPAGMDNEGFEAEVFFTAGTYAAGQALVRAADCDGQWDIDLVLVDTTELPGASPAPGATPGESPSPSPSGTAG